MILKNNVLTIIPTYNEEKTILNVIRNVKKAIPNSKILIIDGYSQDSTTVISEPLSIL